METRTTKLAVTINHCGENCNEADIMCKKYISLSDPAAGPQYCGICGLFSVYLKATYTNGVREVRRCAPCRRKF